MPKKKTAAPPPKIWKVHKSHIAAFLKRAGHTQSTLAPLTHRGAYRRRFSGFVLEEETDPKTRATLLVVRYDTGAYWHDTEPQRQYAHRKEIEYVRTLRERYTVENRVFPAPCFKETGNTYERWVIMEKSAAC